jgi:Ser/Thr protein kinase RdoA (MazF antagonist)
MTPDLSIWGFEEGARAVTPSKTGLINQTFHVERDGQPLAILQCLNTQIFDPVVHEDIDAVTGHLVSRGVPTPRLVPCRTGALWHTEDQGAVWRCLTWVGDTTLDRFTHPSQVRSAGHLVGRWHAALGDLSWSFRSVRAGAHDTEAHLAGLARAVEGNRTHRLYDPVASLAESIARGWSSWDGPTELPTRVIHGDLKVSNLRFTSDEATALIDLDTCGLGSLDVELGDALRSWCNPQGEDEEDPSFRLDWFEEALKGYAEGVGSSGIRDEEWEAIVPGVERIAWELAARFCRDALEESYFGWDARWGSSGDHNLHRARGQVALAGRVRSVRVEAEGALRRARA